MTFEIVADLDSLEKSAHGPALGRIYILSEGQVFPDDRWWDFPCVVLGWWLRALENDFDGVGERGLGEVSLFAELGEFFGVSHFD